MSDTKKLLELYHQTSKHSNYQIVASQLEQYIGNGAIKVISRHEKERLKFIEESVDLNGKRILDIGGNTGYFTFEAIARGASSVSYYDGNEVHSMFINEAVKILDLEEKIEIHNDYYLFEEGREDYDIIFLLNVLHHIGDDYGDSALSKAKALYEIAVSLRSMADKTKILILQLGFNWKGDRHLPLFESGTKKEMIDFVEKAVDGYFEISHIGIAEDREGRIIYTHPNDDNMKRFDDIGEFLNRPIFVMNSLVK